jgi:hypothetical protein
VYFQIAFDASDAMRSNVREKRQADGLRVDAMRERRDRLTALKTMRCEREETD